MKALWLRWAARIDARSLRERALGGVAAIGVVVGLVYLALIEPAATRERTLQLALQQQRAQLAAIDAEIAQKQAAAQVDPDAEKRQQTARLRGENEALRTALRQTQRGIVPPARMTALLQQMVRQNGRLKLVSLKTLPAAGTTDGRFAEEPDPAQPVLPATGLTTVPPGAAAPVAGAPGEAPLLYRHGVRIVLRGAYADMVAYMAALERMPAQVFWGRAALDASEHDKSTLTLTLYTLSLDPKWIEL